MSIAAGSQIVTTDFISTSDGTSGKVPKTISGKIDTSFLRFGGTGADGALSISSGTTTVSASSAATLVKNYSSIAITGTAKLAFSTPNTNGTTILLRCQGAMNLTSSTVPFIDASGMGGQGAGGSTTGTGVGYTNGGSGNKGIVLFSSWISSASSVHGNATSSSVSGGAGETVKTIANTYYASTSQIYEVKYPNVFVGGGGSCGGCFADTGATCTFGNSGNGGGALIIEVGGTLTFTTANGISVAGTNAANSTYTGGGATVVSGSGGGGGGYCLLLYNLGSPTGTVNVSGGNGGGGGHNVTYSPPCTSGGGGGGSYQAGNAGDTSGGNYGNGGNGATGLAIMTLNTEFC